MSDRPLISVVLPTYNGESHLRAALESLVAQDERDAIEVIAIDDGSTDSTVAILDEFSHRLRIEVDARTHGANWVASTNRGLARARGAFVALLHQDDAWAAGRLPAIRSAFSQHPEVDVLLGSARFIDGGGRLLNRWTCPLPCGRMLSPCEWFPPLLVQNFIPIPVPIVRREAMLEAAPLDESLLYAADWKLWLALAKGRAAMVVPGHAALFRVHGASQTLALAKDPTEYRRQIQSVLDEFAPALGALGGDADRWLRPARYSIEVNAALVSLAARRVAPLVQAIAGAVRIGPDALQRYLRYSRIRERALARIRAGVGWGGSSAVSW